MDPEVQLFRYVEKLTEVAVGEPAIVLIECDRNFGLIVADSAEEGSTQFCLYLRRVSYLRIRKNKHHRYLDFDRIKIWKMADLWVAQECVSGNYFPAPSVVPYHVIFISRDDYAMLCDARKKKNARLVYRYAQERFGRLPGFFFSKGFLGVPDEYAECYGSLQGMDWVDEMT